MVKNWIRGLAVGAMALGMSAAVAGAQNIEYTTSGVFGGTGCAGASCAWGTGSSAVTLTYTGVTGSYFQENFGADFGIFTLGAGKTAKLATTNQTFTLFITQTSPTAGGASITGAVTGSLVFSNTPGAYTGGLFFVPSSTDFMIGDVNYSIYTDNTGKFAIASPTSIFNPNNSVMRGSVMVNVSTVPEPGTILLLGSGIAGLGLFGLRRRQKNGV